MHGGACCLLEFWLKLGFFAAQHGEVWVRIPLERKDLQVYVDQFNESRISFIFRQQAAIVAKAYSVLSE